MTYLHHRWAIDSGVRYICGTYHNYVVKGDSLPPTEIVPPKLQRDILGLLMTAIQPDNLSVPEPARTLANLVLGQMLEPDKAARLISFADRQENALTLPEAIGTVLSNTWLAPRDVTVMARSLRRVTQQVALDSLMSLAANSKSTPEARAVVMEQLVQMKAKIAERHDPDTVTEAFLRQSERDVTRFLTNPTVPPGKVIALPQPAGAPLGEQ